MDSAASSDSPKFEQRPWGCFTILDEGIDFKVKRVEILPQKRLSYQTHTYRAEHWLIVQGSAKIVLNETIYYLETGSNINVGIGVRHRIENQNALVSLILIEIQRGDYLGEDDIVRLDDDFDRI